MRVRLLLVTHLVAAAAACGCGPSLPHKVPLLGSTATLQSGCHLTFEDAWLSAHAAHVRVWVRNLSSDWMRVDARGFALRLSDGRILPEVGPARDPVLLPPGEVHPLEVGFEDPATDLRGLATGASRDDDLRGPVAAGVAVVVGGVSFGGDPRERVVGEIPLVHRSPPAEDD